MCANKWWILKRIISVRNTWKYLILCERISFYSFKMLSTNYALKNHAYLNIYMCVCECVCVCVFGLVWFGLVIWHIINCRLLMQNPFLCIFTTGSLVPVRRVFTNDPGERGSIPCRVIPKTLKIVLDTSLLNTQQYEVRIVGKVEQSSENHWKGSLLVTLANFYLQFYFKQFCLV